MTQRLAGYATPEGTERFKKRYEDAGKVAHGHFRQGVEGLWYSSLGMGSYLGNPDPQTDADMVQAVKTSVASGAINVLDTAINYRYQNSERSFGQALQQLVSDGTIQRDEVFVASKNGFLTPDAAVEQDFRSYFRDHFITPGVVNPDDIVGGMHCMSPTYLQNQLERSLENLQLDTLDLMYLHNAPESQLPVVGRDMFMERLKAAFEYYESARGEGKLRYYGLATWDCFRVNPDHDAYLNLEDVVNLARVLGGERHGFRYVQLPFNLAFIEALTLPTQRVDGEQMCFLQAAQVLGIGVFTSVPLLQGQLLGHPALPSFNQLETSAQCCLQFVRSTPVILAPLIGHKSPEHVAENLKVASVPPLTEAEFQAAFLTPAG